MQKVVGSSPIIRLRKAPFLGAFPFWEASPDRGPALAH